MLQYNEKGGIPVQQAGKRWQSISKKQKKRPFSKLIPWILGKHGVSFDELMRISERNCFFYAGYDRFMQVLRRALRKPLWLRRPVLRCR